MRRIRWVLCGMAIISVISKMAGNLLGRSMESVISIFTSMAIVVPIVHVECNFKRALRYGDRVIVETRYLPCEAAKLKFSYHLYNQETKELVATGSSVQVFLDKTSSALQLTNPDFFEDWKKQHALQ